MRAVKLVTLLLCSLVAVACGDDKDWDEEIILQLFKTKNLDIDEVVIRAKQGEIAREVQVSGEAFADCTSNRVRIIPRGASGSVQITVSPSSPFSNTVRLSVEVPADGMVPVFIGERGEIVPTCGVQRPDAGLPDGGTDGLPPLRQTGAMCTIGAQCVGGTCLKQVNNITETITFPKGYCSRECSGGSGDCGGSNICYESKVGTTTEGYYCLQYCEQASDCLQSSFRCTGGSSCMP
jgi:hypothetical protein